jgi:hypothetical protein
VLDGRAEQCDLAGSPDALHAANMFSDDRVANASRQQGKISIGLHSASDWRWWAVDRSRDGGVSSDASGVRLHDGAMEPSATEQNNSHCDSGASCVVLTRMQGTEAANWDGWEC